MKDIGKDKIQYVLLLGIGEMDMKFEYMLVSYIQERTGYRFCVNRKDEGIIVNNTNDILPILNHYGLDGWEFICWDKGRLLFKKAIW